MCCATTHLRKNVLGTHPGPKKKDTLQFKLKYRMAERGKRRLSTRTVDDGEEEEEIRSPRSRSTKSRVSRAADLEASYDQSQTYEPQTIFTQALPENVGDRQVDFSESVPKSQLNKWNSLGNTDKCELVRKTTRLLIFAGMDTVHKQ